MKMKEKGHSLEVFLFCRFPRRLCVISGGNGMGCVQSGWEGGQGGFLCVCVSVHAWGKDGSWEGMKQKKKRTPVHPSGPNLSGSSEGILKQLRWASETWEERGGALTCPSSQVWERRHLTKEINHPWPPINYPSFATHSRLYSLGGSHCCNTHTHKGGRPQEVRSWHWDGGLMETLVVSSNARVSARPLSWLPIADNGIRCSESLVQNWWPTPIPWSFFEYNTMCLPRQVGKIWLVQAKLLQVFVLCKRVHQSPS